jgi:DMSO/TMAO reductase YedYZ molybdopterin-dependent catalytic subunit
MRIARSASTVIRLVGLILALSTASYAQSAAPTTAAKPTGPDRVSIGGHVQTPLTLSIDDLRKLPHKTIQVMDTHTNKQETYEGVPLGDLLKQAGVPQGEQIRGALMTSYLIAEGSDGYRALFSLAELDSGFEDSGVLIAYSVDGAPISGDVGPLRLVAPNDKRPARWVRMLASITVGSAGN